MEENISQPEKEFSPSSSPKQTIPNPKPKFSPILTGILLLVLGGVGGFLLGRQSLQPKSTTTTQVTPLPSETPVEERVTETPSAIPTLDPTAEWKTYENKKYKFSFSYPQSWQINTAQKTNESEISLSNIAPEHVIYLNVWQVTGFGYCYKYGEEKNIVVDGKTATTADGIGGTELCDNPEEFSGKGNTFVLIPLENDNNTGVPSLQIHVSYDYPLEDIELAKSNLDLILSTFKFLD